jgi:cytochrome d ubiquinol oxidase subunit II
MNYALLGSSWLVDKAESTLRDRTYTLLPFVFSGVFVFLAIALSVSLAEHLQILHRWSERPYLLVFPEIGLIAAGGLLHGVRQRHDATPFRMNVLILGAAFGTLAASFWPFMIPFSVTMDEAAAPASSLSFMFWGAGIIVLPLTLAYTLLVYRLFRGKLIEPYEDQ